MIKNLHGEVWRPLQFPGWKNLRKQYALSSFGRIASFTGDSIEDGKILNGSLTTGYRTLNLHRPGNNGTLYVHREIARLFLKKPSNRHKFVIHLNHNKLDNHSKNLTWVTLEEMIEHQQDSPAKLAYKKLQAKRKAGIKLDANAVKLIKKTLHDKKRTLTIKKLAEKFGVSEMTVYRIKSGENWAGVK